MADYDRRGGGGGSSYNPKKRRYRGEFQFAMPYNPIPSHPIHQVHSPSPPLSQPPTAD